MPKFTRDIDESELKSPGPFHFVENDGAAKDEDDEPINYFIFGLPRRGKTAAAYRLALNTMEDNYKTDFRMCRWKTLTDAFNKASRSTEFNEKLWEDIESADFMLIDDIAHKMTLSNLINLKEILDVRHERENYCRTIITSNFSLEELKKRWSSIDDAEITAEAIIGRIEEHFEQVKF